MKIKVLIIGKNGQLGQSIQKIAADNNKYDFYFVGRDEIDLNSDKSIENYFAKYNDFDAVINTAAYTNVDKAETEQTIANQINHLAVKKIAQILSLSKKSTYLIHISTDYVFDGWSKNPYTETSATNPINYYGLSKLKGEQVILNSTCDAVIIRTSWLYSEFGNNFVKTMLKLGFSKKEINIVDDQFGSPTYAGDLVLVIMRLLARRFINSDENYINISNADNPENKNNSNSSGDSAAQTYHFSNNGVCSRYELAKRIFAIKRINCELNPINTKDYINDDMALRPRNSALDSSKIKRELNVEGARWEDSLRRFLLSF